ncbi:MAG: hypothetical protein EP330_26150 [Deltaproteobacteria bacterium]|nr:MAG: hypothetical protein EP330_26150 [Deltaproteobacteria bacterium]
MAAFEASRQALAERGLTLWVVSTADAEGSRRLVDETGLTTPLGVGLPLEATAETLGLFYEPRRHILHAASFLFDRDGRVELAVTSTGAVGRLMPDELLRLLDFWRSKRQPSTKE